MEPRAMAKAKPKNKPEEVADEGKAKEKAKVSHQQRKNRIMNMREWALQYTGTC